MKPACLLLSFLLSLTAIAGSAESPHRPAIGAQVFIEQGQTPAEIDAWFRQLAELHMPLARVFIFWPDVNPAVNTWDFSRYDAVFRSAEKYHVGVIATLTAFGAPAHQSGFQTGTREERNAISAEYIARVVERYKQSPALDTWLLENEPGRSPSVDTRSVTAFRTWLAKQHRTIEPLNRSWGTAYRSFAEIEPKAQPGWNPNGYIDWLTFWRDYEAGQLAWLAQQVHAYDPAHPLHVNPHALVGNLAGLSDNLPAWRASLDSLGCSIHPSWHFGLLQRDRYVLGVSYVNDLIRGSIEPKPHWVTELQGGNNIHSAFYPMNPTSDDIAQWVWTSIGAGADRIIFWLLNARRHGGEAAEWSLLDFQQRPSTRLTTASAIAQTIEQHGDFFDRARPVESLITVILSLETMTVEETYPRKDHPGRDNNAHILEALGVYEALSQLGVPPRLKHFHDYDWRGRTERPRTAVLPDVRAITLEQVADLEAFVANGNTLLITGLTGFYDPYMSAWPLKGYPLSRVTGADLKEVDFIGDKFWMPLTSPNAALPSHLWISTVEPRSAKAIGWRNGEVIATRRKVGNGSVIWIPSPIGLGAWLNDTQPLAEYLRQALAPALQAQPFKFSSTQIGCLMRVLQNGDTYVTVVTNGGDQDNACEVQYPQGLRPGTIWGQDSETSGSNAVFHLGARKTSVARWR